MLTAYIATSVFTHPGWWGHAWSAWGPAGGWLWGPSGGWLWGALLLALCVAAIWLALRGRAPHSHPGIDRARAILAERFARGEMSRDEYRERLDDLDWPGRG
jgi:putative membrane protein